MSFLSVTMSAMAVNPLFSTTITRLRPTTGYVEDSEGVKRTTYASTPITAIVQPSKPDVTNPAPEGERMDSWIDIITSTQILMAGPEGVSDVVVYNGGHYRVMKVEPYGDHGFFSALAQEYHGATPTQPDPVPEDDE